MSYKFWNRPTAGTTEVPVDSYTSDSEPSILHDGDLAYTRAKAGNESGATYQEAVGAPVEVRSPLGYNVGWVTIIFLNVNQMVGTGMDYCAFIEWSTKPWGQVFSQHVSNVRHPTQWFMVT